MSRTPAGLALLCLALIACDDPADASGARWVRVAQDPNYVIYVDTALMERKRDFTYHGRGWAYDVFYRTDHAMPREHKGKWFTREIVRSTVLCDSLFFRVASVDMTGADGKPVAIQRLTPAEVSMQSWRRVGLGTSEEIAARAACHYAARRYP